MGMNNWYWSDQDDRYEMETDPPPPRENEYRAYEIDKKYPDPKIKHEIWAKHLIQEYNI